MEARKFAIGEQVRLLLDRYVNNNPADIYTVSRALPALANIWQYRVQRLSDGQERAIDEQQLERASFESSTNRSTVEAQQEIQRIRNARASERTRGTARRTVQEKRRVFMVLQPSPKKVIV